MISTYIQIKFKTLVFFKNLKEANYLFSAVQAEGQENNDLFQAWASKAGLPGRRHPP